MNANGLRDYSFAKKSEISQWVWMWNQIDQNTVKSSVMYDISRNRHYK